VDVLSLEEKPFTPPVRAPARADPDAYLMFTSGSTGLPKAVRITHHQLLRLCRAFITDWDSRMKTGDHALGLIAYAWDMHLLDIFMPLLQGATLQTLTEAERLDGSRVAPYFADLRPRWCQGTPTLYRALLSSGWDGLGSGNLTCISSGEPLTPPLAANLIPRCGSVVNCYGLTEGTIFQSFCFARDAEKITCGNSCYPDPHYGRTYVIVDGVALTPSDSSGKVGEVAFAGGMLPRRGYENAPELTASKFIPDPTGWVSPRVSKNDCRYGKVMLTGDLGCWKNGCLVLAWPYR
jgi:non-ribosomal peptide synthetase component F